MLVRFPWSRVLALALSSLSWSAQAGQTTSELAELPLDALLSMSVTGASKFTSTMNDAPASVSVVTAADIRALGYRTLADVLSSMRGVTTTSDRSYDYIGVRGFYAPGDYNTRVLLLIDGNRVNDNLYDQAYLGTEFPLDMEQVERVEFIPGQASAVYGANALFGVINVVTRKADGVAPLSVGVSVGSFGARGVRLADSLATSDGTDLQWSVSRNSLRGENVVANGAVTPRGDFEERYRLYMSATHGEFTATALHSDRTKGSPALLDSVAGDRRTRNRDLESLFDLTWAHAQEADAQLTLRAFAGLYRFEGIYALDYPPVTLNEDVASGRWWGVEARETTTRWADHKIMVGGEFQSSPELHQANFDVAPRSAPYLDDHRRSVRQAVFAEDQFKLLRNVTLDGSLRRDDTAHYSDELSTRVALLWSAGDSLMVKLMSGTAFRAPNAFEAYYQLQGAGGYQINPALRKESVRGTELGIEWNATSNDRLTGSLYRNVVRQLIVQTRDDQRDDFRFENEGAIIARGAEIEWSHFCSGGARLKGNLSLQDAEDRDTGVPIAIYAPRYLANVTAIYPVASVMNLGVQWQGVGKRGGAGAYDIANLTLSSPLRRHGWSWSASASNLFDRRHDGPGTDLAQQPVIVQAGRSIDFSLVYGF